MGKFHVFQKANSKDVAKDRLQLMLDSEHIDCPQEDISLMKSEITRVIQKYMNIENSSIDVHIDIINKVEQGAENVKTIQIKGLQV